MNFFRRLHPKLIFSILKIFFDIFKDIGAVLKPCRFSVIMLMIALTFLFWAPQGQDVLRDLAEWDGDFTRVLGKLILFFFAIFFWAFNVWYWARMMLQFSFDEPSHLKPKQEIRRKKLRKYIPRTLGVLAFLVVGGAFFKASRAYAETGTTAVPMTLVYLSLTCLAFAMVFYTFMAVRRSAAKRLHKKLSDTFLAKKPVFKSAIATLNVETGEQAYAVKCHSLNDLNPASRKLLLLSISISILLFLLFWIWPMSAAFFGTATILLLTASSWIPFGSMLVFWGRTADFPVMTATFLMAILFSFWNDNHAIRTLAEKEFSQSMSAEPIQDHFPRWLQSGLQNWPEDSRQPVFFVAAEGGGIRAAYWAGIVLSALQDRNKNFASHLYGISGVSGGSLGAAVFTALAKEQYDNRDINCPVDSVSKNSGPTQRCVHQILSEDFLAPTVAYMLYPDLVQRIFPFPIASFDRSLALETAWEKSWHSQQGSRRFDASFHRLWQNNEQRVPSLFLNSTWVETGKRVITSNLKIDPDTFADSIDFFETLQQEVRLSTAVHNSARFTYVSPAGTLVQPNGYQWGHLVDGGYFENSGAATAYEILTAAKQSVHPGLWDRIIPVVIMISNDPMQDDAQAPEQDRFMTEVLSPIRTLLNTRNARGSYSRTALRTLVEEQKNGRFIHIALRDTGGPLPLGWVLSDIAKQTMHDQMKQAMSELDEGLLNF